MSRLAAASVSADLTTDMNARIQSLARLAGLLHAQTKFRREVWEFGARLQLAGYPGYETIEELKPSLEPRWVVARASVGGENPNFVSDERARAALESARRRNETFVSHSITLRRGIRGLVACVPVYEGELFEGFVVGVFRYHDLFDDMYADRGGLGYAMAAFDGEEEIYHSTDADHQNEKIWGQNEEVHLTGVTWRLRVWPTPDLLARMGSPSSEGMVLIAGFILAALLSVVVYQAQAARSAAAALERARVSRELHDGVIQFLTSLGMHIEAMRRQTPTAPPRMIEELIRIQQLVRNEVANLRDLLQRVRPLDLGPEQLLDFMRVTMDRFQFETGLSATFTSGLQNAPPPPRVCQELARIVQEALANVRKHSGARNVHVRLTSEDQCWKLVVDDDGRGFDFSGRVSHAELDALQKGPRIIKERVTLLRGELTIESTPSAGARLEITIPQQAYG